MAQSSETYLSLGSNIGRRRDNLFAALQALDERVGRVEVCSSLYETEPVGPVEQRDFINLCCRIDSVRNPREFLTLCKEIERLQGRKPSVEKGPRTIDIDLIFYGDRTIREPGLELPHPAFRNRRFVLLPLAEIAPEFTDPVSGETVRNLLERCLDRSRVTRVDCGFPLPFSKRCIPD
ncbi:MAG: 2-amino-4-hydroxy-6-hydroxymethyldihydropteridine diphosphokinase [Acidobacteriota bacterium]|nr:MAG: 2-amino-4-hydroxy-6-hydroxymethyldihydropteridine diphosphokinase [Acidobacteriota bacterium]